MNRFYQLLLLASTFIILPAVFFAASCEGPTVYKNCDTDSLIAIIHSRDTALTAASKSILAFQTIASVRETKIDQLHLQSQRQIDSMTDLAAEIERRDEQIGKLKNRLDSAVAIIKRQGKELEKCVVDSRKAQKQ